MVWEFTEEDRLREQNRLHEAWLRDQRYNESAKKKLMDELAYERKMRKQEAQEREEIEREIEEIKRKAKQF